MNLLVRPTTSYFLVFWNNNIKPLLAIDRDDRQKVTELIEVLGAKDIS